MRNDALIWTEGETDWQHIRAAHLALGVPYTLSLGGIGAGSKNLIRQCRALALVPQPRPTIFIFDRDELAILDEVEDRCGKPYKTWGNNVYSLAIPIPAHRSADQWICIELYYRDEELRKWNNDGRRLFLSSEFNPVSGRHNSDPNLSVGIRRNLPELSSKRLRIIDDEVFNSTHRNVAMSKAAFALNVYDRRDGFGAFNFSPFQRIFDVIQQIILKARDGIWTSIADFAFRSKAIRVIAAESRGLLGPPGMDEADPIERFQIGEQVWLELDTTQVSQSSEISHAIFLSVGSNEVICLCPNDTLAPNCAISGGRMMVPDPKHTNQPLQVYGPAGLSTIYVILLSESMLSSVYDALREPFTIDSLDKIAIIFHSNNFVDFLIIKKEIYIG